jgi:phosphoglycerate dehydrogenase-like enzyme
MALRLAILDDYQLVAGSFAPWHELVDSGVEVVTHSEHLATDDDVVREFAGHEILVVMRERTAFPRAVLERLPDLKLLVTTGMANSSIDLAAAHDLGIEVRGTGGSAAAAPELTWALLMALVRNIPAEDHNLRTGRWQQSVGVELSGKTLGILGLGRIGRIVARYAQAFGMDVIAWSPNLTADDAEASGARLVTKEELFHRSDVVSLHLRLSDRSRHMVGSEELRLLGPQGYLINTARGPLVDEEALLAALHNGRIAGAGLDVFDEEPLSRTSRWTTAPRTVLSPHLGYVTTESYRRYYQEALEDVRAWLKGTAIRVL